MRSALVIVGLSIAVLGCQAAADGAATVTDTDQAAKPAAPAPAQAPAKPVFDSSKAWEHLNQMVSIGPRPSGSAAIRQTRAYITRQISSYGLTVQEQPFVAQTPKGPIDMVNLIVRLPGKRPERILFTGHYDTKLMDGFVGASDGASSGAFLIELARVLKDQPREYTYEFIWFDGEEAVVEWQGQDHTYGSRFYVQAAKKANAIASIKAMVLVDMIGDKNLQLRREQSSTKWLKDIIWGTAKKLGHGAIFLDEETPIEDDHLEFLAAGIPSVDIIDLDYDCCWHKLTDNLQAVSARSLQVVGDVLLASIPLIEKHPGK